MDPCLQNYLSILQARDMVAVKRDKIAATPSALSSSLRICAGLYACSAETECDTEYSHPVRSFDKLAQF